MSKKLFSEFDPVSAKALKQKIQYDLNGADYNDTLIWHSPEGIDVKPFYHREDLPDSRSIPGFPEEWAIGVSIFVKSEKKASQAAVEALGKGANCIVFSAEKPFKLEQLFTFLSAVKLPENALFYFELHFLNEKFSRQLMDFASAKNLQITLNHDVVGNLARSGNWFTTMSADFDALDKILSAETAHQNPLTVDVALYQNAGAHAVQELAYALAHLNEYFNRFNGKFSDKTITFKVAVGSNYFFEIAKLRALRILYAHLARLYTLPETCKILAVPTKRNKTVYDYNNNLLRTTTETMSAVLGGADTVVNLPYDVLYHKTNEFGERISRNQLILLKEESYFDAVSDVASGSYYIECITDQLAEKALALFKQIEQGGGFLKALKANTIQGKIKESAAKEQERFDKNEKQLLGINMHPDPTQQMQHELELYPFVKKNPRKTLIEPIIEKRLAEKAEQERLRAEKSGE